MPKREDERWASWKEEHHKPLCPFCGKGDRLYYNQHYKSWKCGYCEKSFPTPSGVTPSKDEFVEHHERTRRIRGYQRKKTDNFKRVFRRLKWSYLSQRNLLLLLLICLGIAIIVYTILLLTGERLHVGIGVGIIVALGIIGIWNISILKKKYRRIKPGRIVVTLLAYVIAIFVICAFAGIVPFSTAKDNIVGLFNDGASSIMVYEQGLEDELKIGKGDIELIWHPYLGEDSWHIKVTAHPTDATYFNKKYYIEVFSAIDNHSYGVRNVQWESGGMEVILGIIEAKSVEFPISRNDPVYKEVTGWPNQQMGGTGKHIYDYVIVEIRD